MVVTISRMFGAGSQTVAARVGEALGVPVVDRGLPQVVATRLGIAPETAERITEAPKPLMERILGGLAISSPETGVPEDIDEDVARGVEEAIREAAHTPCVILGRGAGALLAGTVPLFRVFLHAPLEWRVARIAAWRGWTDREARAETLRVDKARARYIRERYHVDWLDATHYDLAVDVSVRGLEAAAEAIVDLVRAERA